MYICNCKKIYLHLSKKYDHIKNLLLNQESSFSGRDSCTDRNAKWLMYKPCRRIYCGDWYPFFCWPFNKEAGCYCNEDYMFNKKHECTYWANCDDEMFDKEMIKKKK